MKDGSADATIAAVCERQSAARYGSHRPPLQQYSRGSAQRLPGGQRPRLTQISNRTGLHQPGKLQFFLSAAGL